MEKRKHISIRIDEDVLKKFHYVSKYNDRSASRQLLYLINKSIRDFEASNGKIAVDQNTKDQ